MNDILRIIFFAALGLSVLVLWQKWEQRQPVDDFASSPGGETVAPPPSDDDVLPVVTQTLSPNNDNAPPQSAAAIAAGRLIRVESDWVSAALSEDGGSLVELHLKKHRDDDGNPLPLLTQNGRRYIAQSGLIGAEKIPNHKTQFRFLGDGNDYKIGDGKKSLTLSFAAESGDVRLIKTYTFHKSGYLVDVALTAKNLAGDAKTPQAYFQLAHDGKLPANYSSLLPSFFGAAVYTDEGKFVKVSFEELDDGDYPKKADNGWIGIIQRYFAAVWISADAGNREFFMRHSRDDNGGRVGLILPFGKIAGGGQKTVSTQLFAGAEEQEELAVLHQQNIAPGINLVVDYGWLTFIAVLLFEMLAFINNLTGNWGASILLLTLGIKLIFFPLSSASYRSMAKMKEAAPRIKSLQEKFKGDKQKMQQAMMALYKEEKINPLGGCLPILVQIPVFIALYWVLLGSVELRHAPFGLWLQDLSAPDPYFVLSVLMGVASYLQTRMSPPPPDPTQAMIVRALPLFFSVFSVFFPSGLVLYWVANTVLSISQQWFITRRLQTGARRR